MKNKISKSCDRKNVYSKPLEKGYVRLYLSHIIDFDRMSFILRMKVQWLNECMSYASSIYFLETLV